MESQISNLKFKIEKGVMLLGIQRVQGIIDKRGSTPIFSNILLEGVREREVDTHPSLKSGGQIQVTATDLEIGIKGSYPAYIQGEGGITISGRKLHEIIRELPDGDIDVEVEDGRYVTIKSGKSYFRLAGSNKEDFPSLPEIKEDRMVEIESNIYREMIRKTLFAVAEGDARHVLNGALLEIDGEGAVPAFFASLNGSACIERSEKSDASEAKKAKKVRIRMVGTDGHRLATCERFIEDNKGLLEGEGVRQIIIPKKTLLELRRLLDVNERIKIGIGEKLISFKGEDMFITSRFIEGNYPNYKQVIPQKGDQTVRVNRSNFISVIRRVSVMSREKTRAITIEFLPGKAIFTARDPEIGEGREEMDVDYKGPGLTIGLNYQYLLEALDSIDDDEVVIEMQSNLSPCVIKQESDPDSLCIVMPMRVLETE